MADPSYVSVVTNLGIQKPECPKRKEGNNAKAGATQGKSAAMATQEIHYASMAQVVEPLLMDLVITQESKKLQSMTESQVCIAMSAWMTNYHRNQQGWVRYWLNFFKITVPTVTRSGLPVLANHYMKLHIGM
jgi:hypothetical protein